MAFRLIHSFFIILGFSETFSSSNECGQIKTDKTLSFPWNVGIYLENERQLELVCFGTIIHPNAVLTAAHCFCDNIGGGLRNSSFYIATSNLKKKFDSRILPSTLHKINKNEIVVNSYYKGLSTLFSNDIAIVKKRLQSNDKIKPVCIDLSGFIKDKNVDAKQAIWDNTKETVVDQTYVDFEDCSYDAPESFASAFVINDKSCVKTKAFNIHLNHASEGGGLFHLNSEDRRWYILGIISMHDATGGKFSTYTPVSQYLNWISNIYASL